MSRLTRRTFLGTSAACTALGAGGLQPAASADSDRSESVHFFSDGLMLSASEYVALLAKLVKDGQAKEDRYLNGGSVAELETRFAKLLGKERALFIPTGTLANHLAIRCQANGKSRVLIQAESHVYRDSFDCVPTLSHLNLVPVGAGQATVPLAHINEAYQKAKSPPFPLGVGVISLENPVRRKLGEAFDLDEMKKIAAFARKHDIKMHLDGARLFIASAFTGIAPEKYAELFDTVYISLYKAFNAGAGAILAGPRRVIEQVAEARKIFGAGMYQAWTYAAVALHYLDGFSERYAKAVTTARTLFAELGKHPRFRIEQVPNGTNLVKLEVKDVEGAKYQAALKSRGVLVNGPSRGSTGFVLVVNESINRRPASELAKTFIAALGDSRSGQTSEKPR